MIKCAVSTQKGGFGQALIWGSPKFPVYGISYLNLDKRKDRVVIVKKLYFGSNLKMYKTVQETTEYLKHLAEQTKDISREEAELFIIPSYTALADARKTVDPAQIKLGAQNMFWEEQGQFTGEISPIMLKELGMDLVMAGHSERRHVFGELDTEENKKVKSALAHNMKALLCIGETGEEKDYGLSPEVLRTQLKIGFHGISQGQIPNLWVAYEPVWSIGVNGTPASPDYAEEMHKLIKQTLKELFGGPSKEIPVLYGGSVNPQNAEQLIAMPSIDGLFVGRAAWEADKFAQLIRRAIKARKANQPA